MSSSVLDRAAPGASNSTSGGAHLPHGWSVPEALVLLGADAVRGLTETEAQERLERFGPNVLPDFDRRGRVVRFLLQFHHPLVYVLLAAGVVTAAVGETVDASVIAGVVLLNAMIGFIQEGRSEAALDALTRMVRTEATVVRDGVPTRLSSEAIVPGDIVILQAGDKVPADLRLLEANQLRVNESALTGESLPTAKADVLLSFDTILGDRRNLAFSGTLVTTGAGKGVVTATGADTEVGRIHRLVGDAKASQTPLTQKIGRLSRALTVVILALAAVAFMVGLARGSAASEMLVAAVALAVGAIPEGLPAVVTITLAVGVARMARRHAVIRKLPAVETLGGTTVIFTDKTGTLTKNEMTVTRVWAAGHTYVVTGSGYGREGRIERDGTIFDTTSDYALTATLTAGCYANDARLSLGERDRWDFLGDPTEAALLIAASKTGFAQPPPSRLGTIPFDPDRSYMATLDRMPTGGHVVHVKGSVETVLAMCETTMDTDGTVRALNAADVVAAADRFAAQGLRVLAFAVLPDFGRDEVAEADVHAMTFVGLQAMFDPPRPEVIPAIAAAQRAGVAVKMITGDHPRTAGEIARLVGLRATEETTITGAHLSSLADKELEDVVEQMVVFARVSPEQKLRLVRAAQARGHVVAMTGDGVNDAPALKQADIGVAMGVAGTDVAKDAADMVLTDDNFASIEAAVEEGRGVFDNLTKFIVWTLPTNIGLGLILMVAIFVGAALPILPTQILWINMTTAVALGLMLGFEPKEPGIMSRGPRDPKQRLLTPVLTWRIVLMSGLLLVGSFTLFEWELAGGGSLEHARTVAVNAIVVMQLFYVFNCRSLDRPIRELGFFTNGYVTLGVITTVLLQIGFTYLPFMNRFFRSAPIGVAEWALILSVGVASFVIVGGEKWLRRRIQAARRSRDGRVPEAVQVGRP